MNFFGGIGQLLMSNLLGARSIGSSPFSSGANDIGSLFGCSPMGAMDGMFGMGDDFGMMGSMMGSGNIRPFMQMFGAMFGMMSGMRGLDLMNFMGRWSQMCDGMGLNTMQGLGNAYQQMQMQQMQMAQQNPYGSMIGGVGGMVFGGNQVGSIGSMVGSMGGNYGPYLGATNEGERLAQLARVTGGANGTRGKCLKGVNDTLQRAYGFRLSYPSAYMAKQSLDRMTDRFQDVTNQYQPASRLSSLPPGAIVVWNQKPGHPHGHISISLGNGQEASDHIQKQITGYGSSYTVYMPKDGAAQGGARTRMA